MRLRPIASGAFIIAVLLVGIIGVTWAAGSAYENTAEATHTVNDETLTADTSNWQRVDAPDYALSWYDNETVVNSDGTTLTEGTDYDWNTSTGKILFYDTADVNDGESVTIDYAFTAKIRDARAARDVIGTGIRLALPAGILIALAVSLGGFAVAIVRYVGGTGASYKTKNFGR